MICRPQQCRIVVRDLSHGEDNSKTRIRRIVMVCGKPEHDKCGSQSSTPDLSANPSCMARLINHLNDGITDGSIGEIAIVSPFATRVYAETQVGIIRDMSRNIGIFRKEASTLKKKEFNTKCQEAKTCLANWNEFTRTLASEDYVSGDPIKAYISIIGEKRAWSRKKHECSRCGKDCIDFLEKLRRILLDASLISKFIDLKLGYDENERERTYSHFLQPLVIPRAPRKFGIKELTHSQKLQEYSIGPFTVTIQAGRGSGENLYSVSSLADKDDTIARVVAEVVAQTRLIPRATPKQTRLVGLDELLQIREREGLKIIGMRFPEIPQDRASLMAKLACYDSTGIGSIAPLLIDDKVEEFFVDQPGTSIYLDHRDWGRCRTNVIPSIFELRRIETRLRAESGYRLDRLNPSLKTELSTREFMIRASLDVPPLAVDGFHLDVRKIERNRFSLAALIKNGTLSLEAAAYLYFCLLRRRNIVAIGEPGSGKTTLINAIDLLTPSHWRKISLEDAIESIPQMELGKHQIRLKVEPLEETKRTLSKGKEIVSLLHRTPDLIYLGEIQTASHSRAMFHALSAGLTGLQTCHADSPEQAMVRWVIHHKIPAVCLCQVGIIIHMKKVGASREGIQRRKVVRISEVKGNDQMRGKSVDLSSTSIQIVDIFKWNPVNDLLEQRIDLYETPSLRSITEFEAITKPAFERELDHYRSLLRSLVERNQVDISTTTHLFDEIQVCEPKQQDNIEQYPNKGGNAMNQLDDISVPRRKPGHLISQKLNQKR